MKSVQFFMIPILSFMLQIKRERERRYFLWIKLKSREIQERRQLYTLMQITSSRIEISILADKVKIKGSPLKAEREYMPSNLLFSSSFFFYKKEKKNTKTKSSDKPWKLSRIFLEWDVPKQKQVAPELRDSKLCPS